MALPYKPLILTSIAASYVVASGIYTPPWYLKLGYVGTFVEAYALQLATWAFYTVVLYPRYFSPLRHLPAPKVGAV
jgi:hypothetical protein